MMESASETLDPAIWQWKLKDSPFEEAGNSIICKTSSEIFIWSFLALHDLINPHQDQHKMFFYLVMLNGERTQPNFWPLWSLKEPFTRALSQENLQITRRFLLPVALGRKSCDDVSKKQNKKNHPSWISKWFLSAGSARTFSWFWFISGSQPETSTNQKQNSSTPSWKNGGFLLLLCSGGWISALLPQSGAMLAEALKSENVAPTEAIRTPCMASFWNPATSVSALQSLRNSSNRRQLQLSAMHGERCPGPIWGTDVPVRIWFLEDSVLEFSK